MTPAPQLHVLQAAARADSIHCAAAFVSVIQDPRRHARNLVRVDALNGKIRLVCWRPDCFAVASVDAIVALRAEHGVSVQTRAFRRAVHLTPNLTVIHALGRASLTVSPNSEIERTLRYAPNLGPVVPTINPGPEIDGQRLAEALRHAARAQADKDIPANACHWLTIEPRGDQALVAAFQATAAAWTTADLSFGPEDSGFAYSPAAVRGLLALCDGADTLTVAPQYVNSRLEVYRGFETRTADGISLALFARQGVILPKAHKELLGDRTPRASLQVRAKELRRFLHETTNSVKHPTAAVVTLEAEPGTGLRIKVAPLGEEPLADLPTLPCTVSAPFTGTITLQALRDALPPSGRSNPTLVLDYFDEPSGSLLIRAVGGAERYLASLGDC